MAGSPTLRGIGLAALAALLFGVTAPFLQRASAGVGSLPAGAFLYLGAGLGAAALSLIRRRPLALPRLDRRLALRLALMIACGAVVAPALLVTGLARADAATASLLLALEGPFTLALAALILREHLGRRVLLAAGLMLTGAVVLGARAPGGASSTAGVLLVAGAALAWAFDNLASRTLADEDPVAVVVAKGLAGAAASALAGAALHQAWPPAAKLAALLAVGALGYGASLQLYLRAQALVGAARTASIFAAAPFVGAVVALALGDPFPGWQLPLAGALMVAGVVLHAGERHAHRHAHEALEHEHLHTHDDGHHTHAHEHMPPGPHSHQHRHEPQVHEHEHSEDLHHRHPH